MGTPQINITDAETSALVRELAEMTGESQTEAVRKAVTERLERERLEGRKAQRDPQEVYRRLMEVAERCSKNKLPGATSDHSFLYDKYGAPI
jgi:antitoxin VapB